MIKHSSRQIKYTVTNTFCDMEVMQVVMPFDGHQAMRGFYSNVFRSMKIDIPSNQKIDKHFIKINANISKGHCNRIIISLQNKAILNTPCELSDTDFKIINMHLEAVKLSSAK